MTSTAQVSVNSVDQRLLDKCSLTQHIEASTHQSGNILALLISHADSNMDNYVSITSVTPTSLSEHHLIASSISFPEIQIFPKVIKYRNLKKITGTISATIL